MILICASDRVLKLSIRCRHSPGDLIESRWHIDWKNRLFRTKKDGLTDLEYVFGHCEARKRSPGNDTGAELMHATNPRSRMRIGWRQWLITIRVCGWPAPVCGTRQYIRARAPHLPDSPVEATQIVSGQDGGRRAVWRLAAKTSPKGDYGLGAPEFVASLGCLSTPRENWSTAFTSQICNLCQLGQCSH